MRMPSIFKKNSFKVFILVVFLLLMFWFLSFLGGVFVILIFSILVTFLLSPLIEMLEMRGVNRAAGILIVYALIAVVIFGLLRTLLPPLVDQVVSLESAIRSPGFGKQIEAIQAGLQSKVPFINFGDISDKVSQALVQLAGRWLEIVTSAGSALMILVVGPFVAFFLLKDGDRFVRGFVALIPNRYFEMTLNVLHKIGVQLGRYIRAWLTEAAIVGALSIIGLAVMGVKYAVIIGIVAGIANLIPYLGPVVGAVPAMVVSVVQTGNLSMLIPIVVLFASIRIIDDVLIVPAVYSRGASMHPLTVVLLILIAAELKGVLGMVLAMPLYTVFKVIARETYWGLESYGITKLDARSRSVSPGEPGWGSRE
jgi:predicted PurR-regulated permease PerM